MRVAADRGGGDVERGQIGPAEGAFRHLRGRNRDGALDRAVGSKARDAGSAPVADPQIALRIARHAVGMPPALLEAREGPGLADGALASVEGMDDLPDGVG